jgi:FeS assembly SUF system protein
MPEPLDLKRPVLNPIERSLLEAELVEAIRMVYDPEIPVNVYDLGLIYDIQLSGERNVHIMMTLTSPACPVAGILPGEVESMVRSVPGVGDVSVELTWDPPFTIEMMSDDVRLMLGL